MLLNIKSLNKVIIQRIGITIFLLLMSIQNVLGGCNFKTSQYLLELK
mgnify:CR=1